MSACGCPYEPEPEPAADPMPEAVGHCRGEALAMFYFPLQNWQDLYCEEEGLVHGTIFKELNKPFYGPKCGGCHDE